MGDYNFAISEVEGQLCILFKNLMQRMNIDNPVEAIRKINSGEWVLTQKIRSWFVQDKVVHLKVTSDGATGLEWIIRFKKCGLSLSDWMESLLLSNSFRPTSGITYEAVILKSSMFVGSDHTLSDIIVEADSRNFTALNVEAACLIRENFSDREFDDMGLWFVMAMYKSGQLLFVRNRNNPGKLDLCYWSPGDKLLPDNSGYVFAVPAG